MCKLLGCARIPWAERAVEPSKTENALQGGLSGERLWFAGALPEIRRILAEVRGAGNLIRRGVSRAFRGTHEYGRERSNSRYPPQRRCREQHLR